MRWPTQPKSAKRDTLSSISCPLLMGSANQPAGRVRKFRLLFLCPNVACKEVPARDTQPNNETLTSWSNSWICGQNRSATAVSVSDGSPNCPNDSRQSCLGSGVNNTYRSESARTLRRGSRRERTGGMRSQRNHGRNRRAEHELTCICWRSS